MPVSRFAEITAQLVAAPGDIGPVAAHHTLALAGTDTLAQGHRKGPGSAGILAHMAGKVALAADNIVDTAVVAAGKASGPAAVHACSLR